MARRLVSLLICAFLALTVVAPAFAAPGPKVSLEEAVAVAKAAFPVPAAFTEFRSGFSSWGDNLRWEFNWEAPAKSETPGHLSVTVDAETKDILSMYTWQHDPAPKPALPAHSRAEAEKVAREFAAKIQPRFAETRLAENRYPELYYGNVEQYEFFFERLVNGIPFAQDGIRVSVDANSLRIVGYNYNWSKDAVFPAPEQVIDQKKAAEAFFGKAAPRLIYFRPRPDGDKERPVLLVYSTEETGRYGVDALTGEVILLDQWYGYEKGGMGGEPAMAQERARKDEVDITPAEEAEIKELAGLLTQEEALAKATAVVKVPAGYKLTNTGLSKNWEYPSLRRWDFSWSLESKGENRGGSLHASVDAKTGDLISFSRYEWDPAKEGKEPKVKYTEEQAQKIAAAFIERLQPERFAACRLEEPRDKDIIIMKEKALKYPTRRSYSFSWVRYVNDIPFPQQGFTVEVNAETGELNSFNMNWAEVTFPAPEGLLNQEDANSNLLAKSPLLLEYLTVPEPNPEPTADSKKPPVRLVYHVRSSGLSRMFDARTGVFLDWEGNPLPDKKTATFSDIAGHPAADDITLLAERNVVTGAPDGKFHPEEDITQPAYLVMLLRTIGYQPREQADEGPWYSLYEKEARRRGILKEGETLSAAAPTTREQAAVWVIRALGQDRIASLPGIWKVPAADAGAVKHPGHVALYIAQGLDPASSNGFEPAMPLTRAEAAQGMVQLLRLPRP